MKGLPKPWAVIYFFIVHWARISVILQCTRVGLKGVRSLKTGIAKWWTGLENRMENGMENRIEKWNRKWKSCIKSILI